MGTLTKIKATEVFKNLGNHISVVFKTMLESDVYDENDLEEIIAAEIKKDSTTKGYLNNVKEITELTEKDLIDQAKRFDYSPRLEDKIDSELEKVNVKNNENPNKKIEKEQRQRIK